MMSILMLIGGGAVVSSAVFVFALARVAARADARMEEAFTIQALQDQRGDVLLQDRDASSTTSSQPVVTAIQPYNPARAEDIALSH